MVVTRDDALAQRIKVMRLHGISRDAFDRFTAKVPSWYYEIVAPGFKYNLTDIASAHRASTSCKRAREFQQQPRRRIAHGLRPARSPACRWCCRRGRRRATCTPGTSTWCAWPTQRRIARDTFIEQLFAAGIGCSVHYIPLHLQPYWRDRYAPARRAVPAQPARLRAHGQPADVLAHDRGRRAARRRGAARAALARLRPCSSACSTCVASAAGLLLLAPLFALIARGHQARVARPGVLPPGARRPPRPALPHLQVPHHDAWRRPPAACRSPWPATRASRASARSCAAASSTSCAQLIDVLRGTMSLVGPRPEVPRYVAHYPPALARAAALACARASPTSPRCATATRTSCSRRPPTPSASTSR